MKRIILLLIASFVAAQAAFAQVPYERLRDAQDQPESWLTYSGSYRSDRFSNLDQITPENTANLRTAWVYQVPDLNIVEATPLVVDDVMYITEPHSRVVALDARSGRLLWKWSPTMSKDLRFIGFPPVNRGVAILDDTVFVGTLDAHLVALDARSGAVRWDIIVADNSTGHSLTVAPLAIDGKIVVGISGGEAGIRGFLDAYDAKTGERKWRFWTIPDPDDPGADTWGGESWRTGGGATWLTGSFDPELNLIYWGVGNPAPDWNGDARPGDNLYTCSLIAVDADTGELRWHFQYTPHDVHDWDANQIPVLLDTTIDEQSRKLVAMANRNGFYYLLDRETGEFLLGTEYAKQTWAEGLDTLGRPIVKPGVEPSVEGTLVYPSLQGATNWFSPSYSSQTGLLYVSVREMGSLYFKGEAEYIPGTFFTAGGEQALSGDDASGAVRALDVKTGEVRWNFPLYSPPWAGVLSTAGGLVFGGTEEGNFFALDALTGDVAWEFQTGGSIRANPISFSLDDKQHIAIAAGQAIFVFTLP